MPSEPGEPQYTVPDDMKITIAKVIALQSLATDPGQQLAMTASVMRWVRVGLVLRYGSWENVPDTYKEQFTECRENWQDAIRQHGLGSEFWPHAMMRCADVADEMAVIAGIEDMLDYRQLDFNFTEQIFGPPKMPDDREGGEETKA